MARKVDKQVVEIVTLDSSDDDEAEADNENIINTSSSTNDVVINENTITTTPIQSSQNLPQTSRSFWKAGDYAVGPTSRSSLSTHGAALEHARVHPKFLHSNATSHKWAFGAIAELMDNAVDEMQNGATFVNVDKIELTKDRSPALLFQDDGGGMDPQGIRKCMSLGYSSKNAMNVPDGNGFKTSTMRLGADVIVFTRAGKLTQSVGLLSYTFLRKTGQDDVIVPMVDFDISSNLAEPIVYGSKEDWSSNLKTILEWSPFASKEELMQQFEGIEKHGTKIIIYNLWLNDEGVYELSLDDDDEDICLRDETQIANSCTKRTKELQSHISYRIRYSLRAYASILYLKKFKNFTILLRGKPLEQFNIADELKLPKIVTYKPTGKEDFVETKIGFIKEAPNLSVSGFNVYHKNRLIRVSFSDARPFWKVVPDGTIKGMGVVGVLEANFIEPAHDKQDFERSLLFVRLETRLKQMVYDYWKGHCHLIGYKPIDTTVRKMVKAAEQAIDEPVMDRPINVETSCGPTCENVSGSVSIDQLCEENIRLFMRCEEHMQEEADLTKKVQDLESELVQSKRKFAKLAMIVEAKKKQKGLA
ncbi:hypothetical protein ACFE04_024292 [Oxalis oulophora]